jgi:hypothetical protein
MTNATKPTKATGNTRPLRAALMILAATWASAASTAHAQQGDPSPAPEAAAPAEAPPPTPPVAEPPPPPSPAMPAPVVRQQAPEPDAPELATTNDLDPERRPVGIGYAGVSQVPVGGTVGNLTAPAVGARIWFNPKNGLDVAIGLAWADGSSQSGSVTTDLNAVWGFVLQAGLPIAVSTHRHVSFQIIPTATYAYGTTKVGSATPFGGATTLSGWRLDLGVRAGLEIFWGFIGLPQLSLSSTVGIAFETRTLSSEESGVGGINTSATAYGITTTVQNNPWDIFTGNVAARYYF